jgi:IS5 family transposase
VITSATPKDDEAHWVGHRREAPVHEVKGSRRRDRDGGIVRDIAITPANVNDRRMLAAVLPESPGEVYADLAYAGAANEARIRTARGRSCSPSRGVWVVKQQDSADGNGQDRA